MPTFTYSNSDFVAFTKARASDVNTRFADIKTFFNTTKLDNSNIQTGGVLSTNLSATGSTAGQFLASNGSIVLFTNNPLSAQYNYILGSAAQVTAGTATNSTFASITQADGDRILILPAYATNEAWTITKKLFVMGLGNTSDIQGAITLNTGASETRMFNFRTRNNLTIASGVVAVYIDSMWFSTSSFTFVDNNSTPASNFLQAIQET